MMEVSKTNISGSRKQQALGVTEFMLRMMAWLCTRDEAFVGSQTCLYKRLKMDYHYGLGKIYTQEEIDKAKLSPGFDREYSCQYLGLVGNVFSPLQIDKAIELGEQFKGLAINPYAIHSDWG